MSVADADNAPWWEGYVGMLEREVEELPSRVRVPDFLPRGLDPAVAARIGAAYERMAVKMDGLNDCLRRGSELS